MRQLVHQRLAEEASNKAKWIAMPWQTRRQCVLEVVVARGAAWLLSVKQFSKRNGPAAASGNADGALSGFTQ
jgi:hypothetical protein